MEEIKILIIVFCMYAIFYCVYAVKVVLVHKEIQLRRFKQIETDTVKLNKLYLHLVSKCEETPKKDITINEISLELRRLKRKAVSFF